MKMNLLVLFFFLIFLMASGCAGLTPHPDSTAQNQAEEEYLASDDDYADYD